jgi:hypothetical protein
MGFLFLGLLTYFVLRRAMPNVTFHVTMMVDSKILLGVLFKTALAFVLLASLLIGLTSHLQVADVLLFPLCFIFVLVIFRSYAEAADDSPRPIPFLRSLASRAPPVF